MSALPFQEAHDEIELMAGTQFDPQVVRVFLRFRVETWEAIREQTQMNEISATLASIATENPIRSAGHDERHAERVNGRK